MSIENTTTEQFGVARADNVLHVYPTIGEAKQQHAHISDTMQGLGLEPDVDLVTVQVKTTYGKPKPYREDVQAEPEPEEQGDTETPTE